MSPPRIPRPCLHPGCPELVRDGPRCEAHQRQRERQRSRARRASGQETYDDAAWRRFRVAYLRSVGWRCETCGTRPFDTSKIHVHHIVPVTEGGERLSFANAEAACGPCHNRKHPEKGGARWA